jgi:hypothetical protein
MNEITALKWAIEKAERELNLTGRNYRKGATKESWVRTFGPDSLGRMTKIYEEAAQEERDRINALKAALETIREKYGTEGAQ